MYSREDLDRIEAEWAFHFKGHAAFLDAEGFQAVQLCAAHNVPADRIIQAIQPGSKERHALRAATFPNILRLLL